MFTLLGKNSHVQVIFHLFQSGQRSAMVYMARAYDTGLNLPDPTLRSVSKALYWYECIEDLDDEEGDGSDLVSSG